MLTVRKMEKKDIPWVEQTEKAIFSLPWSAQSLEEAAQKADNIYLICELDGVPAGYCGMWGVLGEGNITNVAVAEPYRRHGVADALLKELLHRGGEQDIGSFFLEVRESNAAARHLYEKNGFRAIGLRRNFYERPAEDAIVMAYGI